MDKRSIEGLFAKAEMEREWREKYGHIPPILHATYGDKRWVSAAIGQFDNKRLYEGSYGTFIDFLQHYIPTKFGIDWWKREVAMPREERHQVLKWCEDWTNFQRQHTERINGLCTAVPDGSGMSYIHLGYELYLVEQQGCPLPPLMKRLRNPDNFQGARYELFAAAACVESGFSIQWLPKSGAKQVEFIATHQVTRDVIAVEAKSRHRDGVLGFQSIEGQKDASALMIDGLILKAIAKPSQHAKVAFVDLNYPPAGSDTFDQIVEAVKRVTAEYAENDSSVALNMVVFTNFGYHYGKAGHPYTFDPPIPAFILRPEVRLNYSDITLGLLQQNLGRAREIPEFGPEDQFLKQGLLDTFSQTSSQV